METLEVSVEEIRAALLEMGIDIELDVLKSMPRDFLMILQSKLFDIKKIKKEMEFLIQNSEILRSLIDTYQQKIKALSEEDVKAKSKDDNAMEM